MAAAAAAAAARAAPPQPGPLTETKLLAAGALFAATLLCGYLPVRAILNQRYVQHAMFAGGGVLMATAFCHLIPETHDAYRQLLQAAPEHQEAANGSRASLEQPSPQPSPQPQPPPAGLEAHLVEITLCCGFFFMYLVEQLMVRFINNRTHEHPPCDSPAGRLVLTGDQLGAGPAKRRLSDTAAELLRAAGAPAGPSSAASSQQQLAAGAARPEPPPPHSVAFGGARGAEFYKFARGLLIVSAFMAHSIFDGVAIGSQESPERVWTVFAAIACHKLIIAAVVGLELFSATLESHGWTLAHLALFSAMSPLGILLVVAAQSSLQLGAQHPAMVLLQSFATGTLLYIVFIEILQPKDSEAGPRRGLGLCLSLVAGFALMVLVLALIGD